MKRTFKTVWALAALAISLLCCGLLFGCGANLPEKPEVTDVAVTAADGVSRGRAGALHRLSYTVPEGSEVSVSVELGDSPATADDFACLDGDYVFYKAGEYTITVYAAKDGMLGSAFTKLTVTAGDLFVSDLDVVAAAGETFGKVGALHLVKYMASEGCDTEVSFTKDGAAADVAFDPLLNTAVFGSAGSYTVKVTASRGTETPVSAEKTVEITAQEAPSRVLSVDKTSVTEDETVTVAATDGGVPVPAEIKVLYKSGSAAYADASGEQCTVIGCYAVPHRAGSYKIVWGDKEAEFTCTPLAMTLSEKEEVRHRIQTDTETEIGYAVTGGVDKYNVTFDTHGNGKVHASAGDGYSVRVTSDEADWFSVTVKYTHKADSSLHHEIELDFYSVDSLFYSPVWGEDPFDGMPGEVLTNMGHLLSFDAKSSGGAPRELTARDASYEVVENHVTAATCGTGVEIRYAAGNYDYPYLFQNNLDDGVATGNFTLKMKVTDPYTGYSAVALKEFTVTPTGNSRDNDKQGPMQEVIQNYVARHSDYFNLDAFRFVGTLGHDVRLNMVLTREGTIISRVDAAMPLNTGNQVATANISGSENCRLEFAFTPVATSGGRAELGIGLRVQTSGDGWTGFLNFNIADGRYVFNCGLDMAPKSQTVSEQPLPEAKIGETVYLRIDRRTSGGLAEYSVFYKEEGGTYQQYMRFTYEKKDGAAKDPGSAVSAYQFDHRDVGCFAIEHLSLTAL